jgi:hypothetical protein
MNLYVAGEKVGVSIEKNDVEDAFGKFGKLGMFARESLLLGNMGATTFIVNLLKS